MTLKASQQDGVTTIHLHGDVDMEEVVQLKNLISAVVADGCSRIVLDFLRVQHVNVTGLGILADRLRFVRIAGGDLRISSLSPYLQHVFELTGIRNVFRIYDTAHLAARSFQNFLVAA